MTSELIPSEAVVMDKVVPGLTGIIKTVMSGNGGDLVQAASNVVQKAKKEGLLKPFLQEWEKLVSEGKVQPEFGTTEIGLSCIQELLDSLDKDLPDDLRFQAMKTLLIKAADVSSAEQEKIRIFHLMKICRQLTGAEILILNASYRRLLIMRKPTGISEVTSAAAWPAAVADFIENLLSEGVIEHHETSLIRKNIIGDRTHTDRSGFANSQNFRLTKLGIELGELLAM